MSSCLFSAVIHLELDAHDRVIVPIRGLFPHPEDGGREGSLGLTLPGTSYLLEYFCCMRQYKS